MQGAGWAQRARAELNRRGWSVAELARRCGVSEEAARKQLQGRVDQPRGGVIGRYARALGVHEHWLRTGQGARIAAAPLIGYVGAGEEFYPFEDHAPGSGLDEVDIRLDVDDPVAIRVRGRSMIPVYRPGDDLFCARLRGIDLDQAIGRDCVVMTTDGAGYVKQLRRDRNGRFVLRSYNPAFEDIESVELEWAAPIVLIKRAG